MTEIKAYMKKKNCGLVHPNSSTLHFTSSLCLLRGKIQQTLISLREAFFFEGLVNVIMFIQISIRNKNAMK